jgi:hypothetical protein
MWLQTLRSTRNKIKSNHSTLITEGGLIPYAVLENMLIQEVDRNFIRFERMLIFSMTLEKRASIQTEIR